jgi:hypothetical protein
MSRAKPFGSMIIIAGIASAVHATCWQIYSSSNHHFADGSCVSGCDDVFPNIYPGGRCAAPVSTGSKQIACFPGTTGVNPDGTMYCSISGFTTIVTVPSGMRCEALCAEPVPE